MSANKKNGNITKNDKIISKLLNSREILSETKECTSTPIELLVEFLYSVMRKDYEKALNYCTQILNYEPHNTTVQQFYPLIVEKLEMKKLESSSSESSESLSSHSSDSSRSSDDEIIKIKELEESNENYKSTEDKEVGEISDCSGSSKTISLLKTKNNPAKNIILQKPLKERN